MTAATLLRAATLPETPGHLVRRRPGARVHAYRGPLTPTARTRRGHSPLCGTRGAAWRADVDAACLDRVCRRCAAWAARRIDPGDLAPRLREFTVDDILASLAAATTVDEVEGCAFAVIASKRIHERVTDPLSGRTDVLTAHVKWHRESQRLHADRRVALATWAARNDVDPADVPWLPLDGFAFAHVKGPHGPELIALSPRPAKEAT
ncbi:MAG: hypothetical protein QOJ92_269 [Frankiales bacterium]|nr:hypothetical protein [Frankiales bacterium]